MMPTNAAELISTARAWLSTNDDDVVAGQLAALIADAEQGELAARRELAACFAGPLTFGTAGLRAPMGPGPARMNLRTIRQAAAGLAAFLTASIAPGDPAPQVVIGFDARHRSAQFARESARVMCGAGLSVQLFDEPVPTPLVAYAIRALHADAAVVVTASHNPAGDNGYKVYLGGRIAPGAGDGVQIVEPADVQIAEHIAAVTEPVQLAEAGWSTIDSGLIQDYEHAVLAATWPQAPVPGAGGLRIVHTALHGVGGQLACRLLRECGFVDVHAVAEQAEPDPDFPTIGFPNPEEPGVLDLAVALARRIDADLIIANDPDADRCAVAVPTRHRQANWRMLHGDEVGALLGAAAIERIAAAGHGVVANSVVSGRLLATLARAHNVPHALTLTGFKWIARVPDLAFGYEEALGYCLNPDLVRDKDGLSTALAIAGLAAGLKEQGRTLLDALDDLAAQYGVHQSAQVAIRLADAEQIQALMQRLRVSPPMALGGSSLVRSIDLATGIYGLAPTNALLWESADRSRVIVRPSGTEPKVKCYLEAIVPADGDLARARRQAAQRIRLMRADLAALGLSSRRL